jgi:hypothetical protein
MEGGEGSEEPLIRLTATDVQKNHGQNLPRNYKLFQNYPNPCNPTAIIKYMTYHIGSMTMKVYDMFGREIALLVNEYKHPGTHLVQWNASGMPSGIYFCQLQAGNVVHTKKLVLNKIERKIFI